MTLLAEEMQSIAQYWEQLLLYTTGSALALEKCFYVAMDWEHNNDVYKLKSKENLALSIQFSSGERRYRETDDHSPKG